LSGVIAVRVLGACALIFTGWLADAVRASVLLQMLFHAGLVAGGWGIAAVSWSRVGHTARGLPAPTAVVIAATGMSPWFVWHVPALWDWGTASEAHHLMVHGSLVLSGILVRDSVNGLGAVGRTFLLLGSESMMMVMAVWMLSGSVTYSFRPRSEVVSAGVAMLAAAPLTWLVLALGHLRDRREPGDHVA
jgi:hypothetical protein